MLASCLLPVSLPAVGHDFDMDMPSLGVNQSGLNRRKIEGVADEVNEVRCSRVLDQIKPTLECLRRGQKTMQRTHTHGVRTVCLKLLSGQKLPRSFASKCLDGREVRAPSTAEGRIRRTRM